MSNLSKEVPVQESIFKMKKVLNDILEVEQVDFKHPLKNSFSLNLRSKKAPNLLFSNGKGSSKLSCEASAYGEFIERLQTNNFFTNFFVDNFLYDKQVKSYEIDDFVLDEKLNKIYNKFGELENSNLIEFITNENRILTTGFNSLKDLKIVEIPINIIDNLYASNGLSTGNSQYEARVQAISEIIERFVKIEVIKNGYSLPKFSQKEIEKISFYEDIKVLEKRGYKINIYDSSLGGKYPVTAISLQKDEKLFLSFGSHPILEVCLDRTFTEIFQGRNLDEFNDLETPTFNKEFVASSFNIENHFIDSNGKILFDFFKSKSDFEFHKWEFSGGDRKKEFELLSEIFLKQGLDIYIKEYSYLGFNSCQIIIPTISEIYPIDDLIYNNKNRGKFYRDKILNYKNMNEKELDEFLDDLEELNDNLEIDKFIGVRFKERYFVSDLKAQIYLKLGNLEMAKEYLFYNQNRVNNLLIELIDIKQNSNLEEYYSVLENLYSNLDKYIEVVNKGRDYLNFEYNEEYLELLRIAKILNLKKVG